MDTKKPEDFNLLWMRERDLVWGIPFLLAAGALANLRKPKEVAMLPLLFLYPSFHLCKHKVCTVSVWIQKKPEDFNLLWMRERDLAYGIPFLLAAGALANLRKLKEGATLPLLFCIPPFTYANKVCNVSVWIQKNRKILSSGFRKFAERKGFEPLERFRSTVFKTAAFDHSAISPSRLGLQR